MYIYSLLQNLLLLFLFNDYLQKNYNDKYEKIFVYISLKTIYFYSILQIWFNNYYSKMSKFLNIFLKHSRLNELIDNYNSRLESHKNNTNIWNTNPHLIKTIHFTCNNLKKNNI